MTTGVFINPGTGDVDGATELNAIETVSRFVKDLGLPNAILVGRNPEKDGVWEGWYAFILRYGERSCTLDVPGVDPDLVQLGKPWVSPRVYVDGSSWLWGFGLSRAHEYLTGGEPECDCADAGRERSRETMPLKEWANRIATVAGLTASMIPMGKQVAEMAAAEEQEAIRWKVIGVDRQAHSCPKCGGRPYMSPGLSRLECVRCGHAWDGAQKSPLGRL